MQNQRTVMPSLPYVNRFSAIALTVGINVVCVLISFGFRKNITEMDFLVNIFICGFTTTLLDAIFARVAIVRLRRAGQLPAMVPTSRTVRLLPKNGILLVLILGTFFGIISYGVNWALIRFYGIIEYTLWPIVVWQALYACGLSAVVMQLVILRMVQPDCSLPNQPEQKGQMEVLDPVPHFDTLKRWFNTATSDFGFNMVVGLLFGGVVIIDQSVVIYPTTLAGIGVSAVILGVIVALRMILPLTKSIADMRRRGELPLLEKPSAFVSRLPRNPWKLTLLMMLPTILISYLVMRGVLQLFNFQVLNFFQYFIIRTLFVTMLTKISTSLTVAIYRQPDKEQTANSAILQ